MSTQHPKGDVHRRAMDVFQRAVALASDVRLAFAVKECSGDRRLLIEVESLLASYGAAGSHDHESSGLAQSGDSTTQASDRDLSGQRLGAYRLERLLGRGGMGAVYLARRDDGEFSKRVAVKLVRGSVATPALLKRFRAERQILADIEHPNIARLIDGGTSSDGLPFFIMEYVEGETLAEVVRRGPVDQATVFRLASQLADALGAVHGRGLVYRDLKPSNVMLAADATIKLLDFGIAKLLRAEAPTGERLTEPGWLIGSPRYMSPEQALGAPVGAASDIFSFGVVIHEALTGNLPFDGDTRGQYLKNLVTADPEPLPSSVPSAWRDLVARCLRKEPAARFSPGGDLALAIQAASSRPDRAESAPGRRRWIAAVLLLGIVGLAAFVAMQSRRPSGPRVGVQRAVVTWASSEHNPRMSPDGRWTSFVSDHDGVSKLMLHAADGNAERAIAPPGGELLGHEWSPASDQIVYLTATATQSLLHVVPIAESSPGEAHPLGHRISGLVRWIGDGIYYLDDGSLWRLDVGTGRSREVTTERGVRRLRSVDVSADERQIVFSAMAGGLLSLWHAEIDGRNARRLTHERMEPRFPRWVGPSSDRFVYVSDEEGQADIWLWQLSTGEQWRLTASSARENGLGVSADGRELLFEVISENAALATLDPAANPPVVRSLTSDGLSDLSPSAAMTGETVAFQRSRMMDRGGGDPNTLILLSQDDFRSAPGRLADGYAPEISPDGRWVAYLVWRPSALAALRVIETSGGDSRLVSDRFARQPYISFPMAFLEANVAWSPRDGTVYFVAQGDRAATEVLGASVDSPAGSIATFVVNTIVDSTATVKDLRFVRDGTLLSYLVSSESGGMWELRAFDTLRRAERRLLRESGSFMLSALGWSHAPETLVLLRSDARMSLVDVLLVDREGSSRVVTSLRDLDRGSATLDPWRRIVYFTRTAGSSHSLHAVSLEDGTERVVLHGQPSGRAVSGIRVREDGRLLFAYQEKNPDIFSITLDGR